LAHSHHSCRFQPQQAAVSGNVSTKNQGTLPAQQRDKHSGAFSSAKYFFPGAGGDKKTELKEE